MRPATVLVVEDNPITRKLFRVTLTAAGYRVLEAANGQRALDLIEQDAPDLVLQDLKLPDMDGFELAKRLRATPAGASVPIVAVSGFLSKMEQAQSGVVGFTDFLFKPVEPSRLVERVQALLRLPASAASLGAGRVVVAVDDDPVQLKLLKIHLETRGFRVITAADGAEAFKQAKQSSPQAVVADVLMSPMDGFTLCQGIRGDPALANVPVVLVSAAYIDEADHALARAAGANAHVVRSPDLRELDEALVGTLRSTAPAPKAQSSALPIEAYLQRTIRQLGRQAHLNQLLTQRVASLEGELAIVASLVDILAADSPLQLILEETLGRCLNTAALSAGAIYVFGQEGALVLRAQIGYGDRDREQLGGCFGAADLFLHGAKGNKPLVIPSPEVPDDRAEEILAAWRAESIVIVPLVIGPDREGVLVAVSLDKEIEADVVQFLQICGNHAAQAIRQARSIDSRLREHLEAEVEDRTAALRLEINERELAQDELRRSEERYRLLAEAAHDDIVIINRDGCIQYINTFAARKFGVPPVQLAGKRLAELFPPETAVPQAEGIEKVFRTGEAAYQEFSAVFPSQRLWLGAWVVPLRQDGGDVNAVLVVARDITERRQLEDQLRQAQKMEAIGQLAGGIAHDFNNVLTVIQGYGELLIQALDDRDPRKPDVQEIMKSADRTAALTRQLLAFGRKQILEPRVVDLRAVVADLDQMLRRLIGEDIELATLQSVELGRVKADRSQIEQVLMNLAINARDAMRTGGKLTIETMDVDLDEEYARQHVDVRPGRHVLLAVSDTGSGMDAETLSRIFEPFFTTKEKGKGTGLGLSMVYGIVKQSGGNIWVYSEPGRGTTFKIYLPRVEEAVENVEPDLAQPRLMGGSETVLLVEDEEGIRKVVCRVLRPKGYTVLEARDPENGLALSAAHPDPIHLLITDIVLPQMSGAALADQIVQERPGTKVLYMSGYTDNAIVHHGLLDRGKAFLPKPFSPATILRKVREVLDAPHGASR